MLGNATRFISSSGGYMATGLLLILGILIMVTPFYQNLHPYQAAIAIFFAVYSLLLVLQAFTERQSVFRAWAFLVLGQFFIVLAASYNNTIELYEAIVYLSGVVIAGGIGHICLHRLNQVEPIHDLEGYYGHIYEHPKLGLGFLMAGLAISGFPISPTFIGLDIVYSNMHKGEFVLPVVIGVSLIFMEIAAIRLYSRVYLGPHVKLYHPVAFRSS